jgi:uncharacterized ion transporter superfamily protein YfcC
MFVIVISAGATWFVPVGRYNTLSYSDNRLKYNTDSAEVNLPFNKKTLDSLSIFISSGKFSSGSIRKPVAVPGTFHLIPKNSQGAIDILQAPIKGIIDSVEIILFLLIIGGFMNVFHETCAIVKGLTTLSYRMKGKEA